MIKIAKYLVIIKHCKWNFSLIVLSRRTGKIVNNQLISWRPLSLDSSVSNGLRFYPSSCPFRPGRPLGCLWVGWGMIWRRQSQPVRAQPQPSAAALFSSTTLGTENIYRNHLIRCWYMWKQYRIYCRLQDIDTSSIDVVKRNYKIR